MHQKNYTMYHHCKKLNPSNHSRYMSNRHVTSPSGMNNDISLRGEEFGAPPERLNYAAPPNRRFSNVSTNSWKWIASLMHERVVWVLESAISPAESPSTLSTPNPVVFGRHAFQDQSWEREYTVSELFASMRISSCAISVVRFSMAAHLPCRILL
jgi:hypothetical protein